MVAAVADRRRRRLEIYVETLEELGVELWPLVACCLWFGGPRSTGAYGQSVHFYFIKKKSRFARLRKK